MQPANLKQLIVISGNVKIFIPNSTKTRQASQAVMKQTRIHMDTMIL
jgi:hypothetical protein